MTKWLALVSSIAGCAVDASQLTPTDTDGAETGAPQPPTMGAEPLALCINEFVAENEASWQDDAGLFPDWIELYNPTDIVVSLDGYYLTDDPDDPFKAPLDPSLTIAPGGFLVFAADDLAVSGPMHLPLALASVGEAVGLFRRDGAGEVLQFGPVQEDFAWARSPDCCADLPSCVAQVWLGTPGATNVDDGSRRSPW